MTIGAAVGSVAQQNGQNHDPEELSRLVTDLFLRQGHLYVNERRPPRALSLRRNASAILLSLDFEGRARQVVVKALRMNQYVQSSPKFLMIHARIREESEALANVMPAFVGHDAEHDLTIREYIAGESLLEGLRKSLWLPFWRQWDRRQALDLTGRWHWQGNAVVHDLDGSFSAEHGIGRLKPYMMPEWRGGAELDLMRRIKVALDPRGLLNPGKLLP